jgi:hypothetical protein
MLTPKLDQGVADRHSASNTPPEHGEATPAGDINANTRRRHATAIAGASKDQCGPIQFIARNATRLVVRPLLATAPTRVT